MHLQDAINQLRLPLACQTALTAFLTPQRSLASAPEQYLLTKATRFEIHSGDLTLVTWRWRPASQDSGGPAVLLVHGWSSRGSHLGQFVMPLLHRGFEVWAFDAHAHGDSPGAYSSAEHHARSVMAVASAMPRVDGAIAHSIGSAALLRACNVGLTLRVSVHLAGPISLRRVATAASLQGGLTQTMLPQFLEAIETVAGISLAHLEPPAVTNGIKHSGLLIHDRADREIPHTESEILAKHWRNSLLQSTDGLGHRRLLSDPTVIEMASGFIAQHLLANDAMLEGTA